MAMAFSDSTKWVWFMKIYLAGGMTVINVIGREREMSVKMPNWRRLFSFYFCNLIYKSEILFIKKEAQLQENTKK